MCIDYLKHRNLSSRVVFFFLGSISGLSTPVKVPQHVIVIIKLLKYCRKMAEVSIGLAVPINKKFKTSAARGKLIKFQSLMWFIN